jgi:hypothetical protein
MAVGRTYSKSRLKEMLNTRMAEYQMLNKTLIEMMEKGSSDTNIDLMKKDIAEKQEAIDTLKDWIQEVVEKEEDTKEMKAAEKESVHDSIKKKPRLAKSVKLDTNLYDSIKKETSKPKEYGKEDYSTACGITNTKPSEDKEYGEYDTPYNHLHYEEEYEKEIIENYNKQTVDNFPLKDRYGDVTYANRFLVRFGTQFTIPEWYVRKVSFFSPQGKEFGIRVFDFVDVKTNRPIIADILGMLNNVDALPFKISIDHLDPTGHVLYTERYHGCRIREVMRNELSYEKDDINTIDMIITYSDVSYETAH